MYDWLEWSNDFFLQQEESEIGWGGNGQLWTLGVGLLFTAMAAAYVTRLAKVRTYFPMDHVSGLLISPDNKTLLIVRDYCTCGYFLVL